jgi:uroporphyrin-III C-methyltransferase/precorrin-2 dehydrogenase/sirohydrochlorin ferrochelatase/uroporphyrin-III C-methyltransferase
MNNRDLNNNLSLHPLGPGQRGQAVSLPPLGLGQRRPVIIAGAGPGDPDLITYKAIKALQQAEVVLTDRLVSEQILNEFVNPDSEVIHVGKQCRRGMSTSQKTINEIMVECALEGKKVVRLKGGDVSIFSNILDELEVLVANNISYEIIPGVTAALGAAAYAGIPLTAREHATAVRFLTSYKSDIVTELYWKELAQTDDTLVFYMSSETLDGVVQKLTYYNIAKDKMLAVVEQATTPLQHVHVCSLYEYENTLKGQFFVSPSLVIIGRVVNLHQQFKWNENSNSKNYYFKPVSKIINSLTGIENEKRHVSRA